jgi:integrase
LKSKSILARRIEKKFDTWVFPSKRSPGEHIPRVNGLYDTALVEAAKGGTRLSCVLYDLQRTFAAAQTGIDLATLAGILGHNGLRVVMKYVHPTAEHRKAAMVRYEQSMSAERSRGSKNLGPGFIRLRGQTRAIE